MLNTLSLGFSLMFLAAVFPPYNVYIAQSINESNYKKYFMIIVFSVIGLALGGFMIFYGSKMLGFPIELLGGAIIFYLGLRMFIKKEEESADYDSMQLADSLSGAFSCMLMSMVPGAFSLTVAKGIANSDLFLVLTVFLAGPILGTTLGGLLLYKGTQVSRLPLNKVGGIMLFFVSFMVFYDYFKHIH